MVQLLNTLLLLEAAVVGILRAALVEVLVVLELMYLDIH
jgi:hypothetical protein